MRPLTLIALACLAAAPAMAQNGPHPAGDANRLPDLQEPAPRPTPHAASPRAGDQNGSPQQGQSIEPDVTIVPHGKEKIEEYSVNGRVYMVKVIPSAGPPYYLIDTTGDGNFNVRRSNLEPDTVIPHWVIFSW